ncbi:MAG: ABC transporter permease subunit [Anaerolineae bacterium]|nr:ABC transporter permease subunit [Anaerolineae bacterium]
MATTSPNIKQQAAIPFWRDVRILGIIGQIIVTILVLLGAAWLYLNFVQNAESQGLKLSFDFLNTTAAFDIAEGIDYQATDTFGRALWVGMVNTVRVSFIGIVLTTILAVVAGIARLSNVWLINRVATIYIEIVRNVPLLVLLFFLYFGVILKLPPLRDSIQPFGLPIFLNQRGIAFPGLVPTSAFPIWLAFIVLALILAMVLWTIQSRQEERTGEPVNKLGTAIVAIIIVVTVGWFVTSSFSSDQAIMVASSRNIQEFSDFESIFLLQVDKDALMEAGLERTTVDQLTSAEAVSALKDELNLQITENGEAAAAQSDQLSILNSAAIVVCGIDESPGVVNAASQLRRENIPVVVEGESTMRRAGEAYAAGDCDLLAGAQAEVAAERTVLETPDTHELVPVLVAPLVVNTPAPAGFNIQGGAKLTPEFAALLIGLVLYTSAFAAEIVRGGILSVSKGQTEAARALGLSEGQRLQLIILPQAMRVIIPPMTSQYLNLTKNSSLAVAIAFPDLVAVGNTVMNQSGFAVQVILIFMASYLTLSLSISAFLNWYNKKVALVER